MKRLATFFASASFALIALGSVAQGNGIEDGSFAKFGIESASVELSTLQAGDHPDITVTLEPKADQDASTDSRGFHPPYARLKSVIIDLPPGLLANLNAVGACTTVRFVLGSITESGEGCPWSAQVGIATADVYGLNIPFTVSIFNLETSGPDEAARLGFYVQGIPVFVSVRVRSDSDYGATAEVLGLSSATKVARVKTTLWGVPGDPVHDTERITLNEASNGAQSSTGRSTGRPPEAFTINPTRCGEPLSIGIEARSYQEPIAKPDRVTLPIGEISGCPKLDFAPELTLTPTTREAAAPAGAEATLTIAQADAGAVKSLASAQLKDTLVRLPEGMTIASGGADGIAACSDEQAGYGTTKPSNCPEASKVASAEVVSPSLTRPIQAAVHIRSPEPGNLFRIWLITDELGVHAKLPGEIELDPSTGQITSLFFDTPQVPISRFTLRFKGGARGVLATPSSCGTYQTHYELTPWSGGATTVADTPFTIDQGCNTGGFAPKLSGGSVNPTAGAFSTLVTDLLRGSGEQNIAGLRMTLPDGVLAKLAGVGLCEGAATTTGECPASSRVGSVAASVGPGPSPLWIPQPGKSPTAIYLSGPYKGGPYGLVIAVPAQAGPFDLGTVVARPAISIDPKTAKASVVADPLPQMLEGVPASYRHVHVAVDRPDFALNPTSCRQGQIQAIATSAQGASAALSEPYAAANCERLPYKPRLTLRLKGGTKRGTNPRLIADLRARPGDANTAKARITMPRAVFLDNAHIGTVCTRVQFAADACPARSIYGRAKAITPLVDYPLEGPLILRSSDNKLPDIIVALKGPGETPVEFELAGRTDSIKGALRNSFDFIPDAPVKSFHLELFGGKRGLVVLSRDLCKRTYRANLEIEAQNGKSGDHKPVIKNSCKKAKKKRKGKKKRGSTR